MKKLCKILIVDDELLIRQGIINYLDWETAGFTIVGGASNGKEAMEMIEELKPHIIITDVVMPVMDGIELVKTVKQSYPQIEIIVLSSFEDYEYVRSTFQSGVADYILKPNLDGEKLLKTLNKAVKNIADLQDESNLSDQNNSIEAMIERMLLGQELNHNNVINRQFLYKNFRLVEIDLKDTNFQAENMMNTFIEKLENTLAHIRTYQVDVQDLGLFILINYHDRHSRQIEQVLESITNETHPTFRLIVSEPFTNVQEIHKAYHKNLLKLKNCLFYLPNYLIISNSLLPPLKQEQKKFDLNYFMKIFKARQFKAALHYALDYINFSATQYDRDSFEFKSFIGNLIFNMIVLMDNLDFNTGVLDEKKYNYFSQINDASTVDEVMDIYHHFLYKIQEIIFADHSEGSSSNLQKMLIYIEENYAEPLSLTKIANHFHFNPSYLSSYFSTHHNEGFNEYLNRIRIKKAMDLLKNSTISISDISEMVGYSGHSYFCKVFKKITGVSPSRYRRESRIYEKNI